MCGGPGNLPGTHPIEVVVNSDRPSRLDCTDSRRPVENAATTAILRGSEPQEPTLVDVNIGGTWVYIYRAMSRII